MFTTINRTMKSWLFGILLAEHVAGIVPPGTHEYSKLVPPPALTGPIADCKCSALILPKYMIFSPTSATVCTVF